MKVNNNLVKALADGGTSLFLVSAADLNEFALFLLENAKAQNLFAQPIDEPMPEQEETIEESSLLSAKEVCKLLNVSTVTLWRWDKDGYLPHIKVGGRNMYSRSQVENIKMQ